MSFKISIVLILFCLPLSAQEADQQAGSDAEWARFGGPDQVDNRIAVDDEPKQSVFELAFLRPYFGFKDRVQKNSGFGFGMDYSAVILFASTSRGQNRPGSGAFRFFGSWDLVGNETNNTGALIYKFEHWHRYTTIAPTELASEIGYAGLFDYGSDLWLLTNLYWRHRLNNGRLSFVVGFLDATDYVDVYALASPWRHFINSIFSNGVATIPFPGSAGLGVAAGGYLTKQIYMIAGFADANSNPTKPFDGFDTFINQNELFKHVELGWTTSKDRFDYDNIHISYWHKDEQISAGIAKGWGFVVSATTFVNDKWMPFLRAGYAKNGGSLLQKSISTGLGYQWIPGGDLVGLGLNWGQPNADTWGSGLNDQYNIELFYRLQLSQRLTVSADLQYIMKPALNTDTSSIFLWGFRGRIAL